VLAHSLTFSPDQDEAFFQELPAAPAVFLLRPKAAAGSDLLLNNKREPYVSRTANLRRRLQRLLRIQAEPSKRLNLRELVESVEFTPTGSDFESQFLLYRVTRKVFPKTYSSRLRLRPAPLIKLHLENEYPRASVTTRLGKFPINTPKQTGVSHVENGSMLTGEDTCSSQSYKRNIYYGPFPSRAAAEKFASDSLDFFKMRRCVDDLHPDPTFPGCVYSEMKMCLAPCFKGCTDAEYHAEVARVQAFFESGGESLTREFAAQREHASESLAFEEAAAIHARMEKLKPALAQLPEIVHRIDRLQAIIIQPGAEPGGVMLFYFANATLSGPTLFSIEQSGEPQSLESRLQPAIAAFSAADNYSTAERMEHLSILKRWYYRSHRVGEIFFTDEKGAWPMRRIVRAIGRVYRGERDAEPSGFSATHIQLPSS
jgi:excinuclease UvrABC nuclease subunit